MIADATFEVPMEMTVLTWILTYALHSTVLVGAVWVVTSVFRRLSLPTKETLWKVAAFGGLATASLQMAAGLVPPWGHLSLPAALDTAPVTAARESVATPAPATEPTVERKVIRHRAGDLTITTIRERRPTPAAASVVPSDVDPPAPAQPSSWPWVVLGLVGLGSAFASMRLVSAAFRLRKQLRGRRDVIEDPVLETFLALCNRAGLKKRVRLSATPQLRAPVALHRREVVIPERAIDGLTPKQQEAMLAHELAHLVRRDTAWSVALATLEAVFFFQPLNHLARRKVQELAEYQCDDWAARLTGSGVHLAKCLAEVAAWVEHAEPVPLAAAMADRGSPIVRRITRLLDEKRKHDPGHFATRAGLSIAALGLVVGLVPGVIRASMPTADASRSRSTAPTLAEHRASRGATLEDVVIHDERDERGIARSNVHIETSDETVRVEVEHPDPPAPPLPPEPPASSFRLRIHGGLNIDDLDLDFDLEWDDGGWMAFGLDDLDALFDGFDDDPLGAFGGVQLHGCGFPFSRCGSWGPDDAIARARARAERAQERAHQAIERARERMQRHHDRMQQPAERARERAERARERLEAQRHAHDGTSAGGSLVEL